MRAHVLVIVLSLLGLLGCGGDEFAEAKELESYRMIGLTGVRIVDDDRPESPAPDVYLDELLTPDGVEVSVRLVDFDPEGTSYRYRHTLCLSVGAPTRFECLVPETALVCGEGVDASPGCAADGADATFQLNLTTVGGLLGVLGGDPTASGEGSTSATDCDALLAGLGDAVDAAQAGCPTSFPIPLIVRTDVIGTDGASVTTAARSVRVRIPPEFLGTFLAECGVSIEPSSASPPSVMDATCMEDVGGRPLNRNPAVASVVVGEQTEVVGADQSECLQFPNAGVPGTELSISVNLSPCSIEQFLAYSSLDGCVVRSEADLGSAAVAFFADAGELLFGNRRLDVAETTLTLPELTGLTRVYIAVRDGRSGLDVVCADIETVAP